MKPLRPEALDRDLYLLSQHPSVNSVESPSLDKATGETKCLMNVRINLPFKWEEAGKTPTGVRSIEPVTFVFPQNYPLHAPQIELRRDFNRSLPHIQFGAPDDAVVPCLYEGNLNELLIQESIVTILEHLLTWLERAAADRLIDPEQGWEPVRRDTFEHIITTNSGELRAVLQNPQNARRSFIFPFYYQGFEKIDGKTLFVGKVFGQQEQNLVPIKGDPEIKDIIWSQQTEPDRYYGKGLALLATPDIVSTVARQPQQYQPETVVDWDSLNHKSKEYRCSKSFQKGIRKLKEYFKKYKPDITKPIPLVVIFLVPRPYPVIGQSSNIELLPYLIEIHSSTIFQPPISTPVCPTGHRDAIDVALLQSLSGHAQLPESRDIVLVGCGSLGSKIGIYLARSGRAPKVAIDRSFLSPHNFARHVLLPNFSWGVDDVSNYKSVSFSCAVSALGQKCLPSTKDVTKIKHPSEFEQLFPSKTWGVINATASLNVKEALSAVPNRYLKARAIDVELFANGEVGLVSVEGPVRNPTLGDLSAVFYDLARRNQHLSRLLFNQKDRGRQQLVGNGCSSRTMQVSDARISLFAASMAEYIAQLQTRNFPDSGGQILIGFLTEQGIGLTWEKIEIEPFHVVEVSNSKHWQVHISPTAHQKIIEECSRYPHVETGGLLMGRYSEYQRVLFVTDVLEAPSDSQRSANRFILGVGNRIAEVERYAASCDGLLTWIGTWHTHLNPSSPSSLDRETATFIGENHHFPFVLLVKDPETYHAIVTKPFYQDKTNE